MSENDLTLDTVEDVRALRIVAASPQSWERVSPQVKSAITVPLAKMMALGGTLDDLLAAVEDCLQTLAHPTNQNFARTTTAIGHVNLSLDLALENRQHANAALGAKIRRTNRTSAKKKGVRVRANAEADRDVRVAAIAYRNRCPYSREHSTRALAAHVARTLTRKPNSIRATLKRLGIK